MLPSLHRNVKVRLLECFVMNLLGCMLFPFMVIYFSRHFGESTAGLLSCVNVVLGAVVSFYGGHLADRVGRRRLLIGASAVEAAVFATMAVANWWVELPVLTFLCCSVNSVAFGLAGPASRAMMIDATTSEERKFVYGLEYWLFNMAMLIGMLVGGQLFLSHKAAVMAGLSAGAVLSIALLVFCIEELHRPAAARPGIVGSYAAVLRDRRFLLFTVGCTLLCAVEFQVKSYNAVKFAERGALTDYTVLTAENTALVVGLGLFATYYARRVSARVGIYVGGLVFLAGTALLAGFDSLYVLAPLMFVATVGELVMVPAEQAVSADLVPDASRAVYSAVSGVVGRAAMILGALAVTAGAYLSRPQMVVLFVGTGLSGMALIALSFRVRTAAASPAAAGA